MNGAECGECGNIQCTCDKYPLKLGNIYHEMAHEHHTIESRIYLALKGILLVLDRIETTKNLKVENIREANVFIGDLKETLHPKRWWQFWKRS